MDVALSDASTISEDRMRAALQSSGSPASSSGGSANGAPSSGAPRGRHRFVQDGEVPVTVLNARHRGPEEGRAATADLERALATERDARSAAEKALLQAEETIRQLQTRLAHAEIALTELAAMPAPPVREEEPAPAPRQTRRRSAEAVAESAEVETTDTDAPGEEVEAAEPGSADEAIEWWRPGWRERLRKTR